MIDAERPARGNGFPQRRHGGHADEQPHRESSQQGA
jgi:hypothetical protein